MFLLRFLGEDVEKIVAGDIDNGAPGLDLDDILKDIDYFIKPDPMEDPSGPPDASAWDQQTSPIVLPIASPTIFPSASASSLPRPNAPQVAPRAKKKGGFIKALNKVKKMFAKKFGGGDQPAPKLSDRLAPERGHEVKWSDLLFPKHQRSNTSNSEIQSTAKNLALEQVREPPALIAYVIYLPYSV